MINLTCRRYFNTRRIREGYLTLKVRKDASSEEIKNSYLKLIKIYHPDNTSSGNHKKFLALRDAYEIIKTAPLLTKRSYQVGDLNHDEVDLSHKAYIQHQKTTPHHAGINRDREKQIERLYFSSETSLLSKLMSSLLPNKRKLPVKHEDDKF